MGNKTISGSGPELVAVNLTKDNNINITPLSKKKPKVVVIDDPNEEDPMDFFEETPSGGNRKIPNFDATGIRSSEKMQVLGISV